MIRAFETHKIRRCEELSSSLWDLSIPTASEAVHRLRVPVPGCWETYPQTRTYRGKAAYERSFEAGGNIRLVFKGVSHTADVFLDGKKIAHHYNAYTPFDVLVTGLEEGTHLLRVEADNSYGPSSTLHFPNDYQTYGGITRGAVMEAIGDLFIEKLHFTPFRKEDGWYGTICLSLRNVSHAAVSGTLSLAMNEMVFSTVPVTVDAGECRDLVLPQLSFPSVKEWSVNEPNLYLLQAVFSGDDGTPRDDLIERIGFREICVSGRSLLLNGKPFFIKGFCRHEDHPDFGSAIPFQVMYGDLAMMREMGANAVRTVHYPNDELFLDLCDELGMLVWEESHARALDEEQMRVPLFMEQSSACVREMITAHFNHPSICIWGFLNECASSTPFGKICYQQHYDLIRSLDQSRPCSFSSCSKGTDLCLGIPDIVSFNVYPEWYEQSAAEDYLNQLLEWIENETEGAGKPFLITETGAGALYGYRTPYRVKWSEEYQAEALKSQLEAAAQLERSGRCIGVFIWQFCDVRVSDEWFFSRPRTMNNKGIVDEYRRPKLAFETVRQMWSSPENDPSYVHFS